jgi:hypothetical protein
MKTFLKENLFKFMKKLFSLLTLSIISVSSFANQNIANDKQMDKYLTGYAKEAAQYQTCGEYDMVDIANVGIYFMLQNIFYKSFIYFTF